MGPGGFTREDGVGAERDQRLCFVGPALGRNPGWVTTQGEILADRFRADGWTVRETSSVVGRVGRLVDTVVSLARWHRDVDIAIVSVFSGSAFMIADVVTLWCRILRIPTVTVLRGGNLPELARRRPGYVRRVLSRSSAVVTPSAFLARMAADLGLTATVIPNTVEVEGPPRPRRRSGARLLWMRTFHPIYDPLLALDAFAMIWRSHPQATLTMAGQDKGLLEEVRAVAAAQPWAEAVTFAGFLGPDQKAEAFSTHDVFLNTNLVDNSPVSVLEAAAAGVPIVATDVGGLADMFTDGIDALLVPAGDAAAAAAAVTRILDDPDEAQSLASAAFRVAEASAWPAVRSAWSELFGAVADGRS